MPPPHQAGVDDLIEGGLGKLGGQFAAQVVQNEQVAVQIPLCFVPSLQSVLTVPEELAGFELAEDVHRRIVNDGKAVF